MNISRLIFAALVFVSVANGDYQIVWSTFDGGGGRSSGGQYVLTGTIGQPDAGYSAGGNFELLGGFWPGGPCALSISKNLHCSPNTGLKREPSCLPTWTQMATLTLLT